MFLVFKLDFQLFFLTKKKTEIGKTERSTYFFIAPNAVKTVFTRVKCRNACLMKLLTMVQHQSGSPVFENVAQLRREVLGLPQITAECSEIIYSFKSTACKKKGCKSLLGFRGMEISAISRKGLPAVTKCFRSLHNEVLSWYRPQHGQRFSVCTLFVFARCTRLPKQLLLGTMGFGFTCVRENENRVNYLYQADVLFSTSY